MTLKKCNQPKRYFALICFLLAWFITMAYAEPATVSHDEVMRVEWWVILALLGIVQGLITYIYLSRSTATDKKIEDGLKSTAKSIEDGLTRSEKTFDRLAEHIEDLYERKLDSKHHKEICPELRDHLEISDKS